MAAVTDVDVAGGGGHSVASPAHGTQYWVEVGRQARALLQKNFKMLRRKKLATVVRVATSVLVVLPPPRALSASCAQPIASLTYARLRPPPVL